MSDEESFKSAGQAGEPEKQGSESSEGSSGAGLDDLLIRRAYEAFEKQQYKTAFKLFKEIHQRFFRMKGEDRSVILTEMGIASFYLADYPAAKTYLEEALSLSDDNDRARIYLGRVALAEYRFSEARQYFTSVKKMIGQAALGLCHLAIKKRDVPEARRYLQTASQTISPRDPEYRLMRTYNELLSGDYRSSAAEADKLVKECEHDLYLLFILAEIFITLGSYAQCENVLRKVSEKCPEHDHVFALLAHTAFAREKYDEARSYVDRSLDLNPWNMYAKTIELKLFMREGKYAEAEMVGKEILHLSPEYSLGHTNLADVYFVQGRYDEAKAEYRATHQPDTGTKGAKLREARLLFIDGRSEDAIEVLERLLETKHSYYDDALCDLVLIYDRLGNQEKKEEVMEKMEMRRSFYHRIEHTLELVA